MPQIIFKISIKDDAWNYVRIAKWGKHSFGADLDKIKSGMPTDLLAKLREADKEQALVIAEQYLIDNQDKFLPTLTTSKQKIDDFFATRGAEIFLQLEKVTARKIYTDKFYGSFTTLGSCPYDIKRNWFMVYYKWSHDQQAQCAVHETMHLQFIYYYEDYCQKSGLSQAQFQDLKEALTFLLNEPEFKKLGLVLDHGYKKHQVLRAELKKLYDQDKNFDNFLEKAIAFMKR